MKANSDKRHLIMSCAEVTTAMIDGFPVDFSKTSRPVETSVRLIYPVDQFFFLFFLLLVYEIRTLGESKFHLDGFIFKVSLFYQGNKEVK